MPSPAYGTTANATYRKSIDQTYARGRRSAWFEPGPARDALDKLIIADKDFRDCLKFLIGESLVKPGGSEADVTKFNDAPVGAPPSPSYSGIQGYWNAEFFGPMNELITGNRYTFIPPQTYVNNWKQIRSYVARYYYLKYYNVKIAGYSKRIPEYTRPSRIMMFCWASVPGRNYCKLNGDPFRNIDMLTIDYRLYTDSKLIVEAIVQRTLGSSYAAEVKANRVSLEKSARTRVDKFLKVFPKRLFASYLIHQA